MRWLRGELPRSSAKTFGATTTCRTGGGEDSSAAGSMPVFDSAAAPGLVPPPPAAGGVVGGGRRAAGGRPAVPAGGGCCCCAAWLRHHLFWLIKCVVGVEQMIIVGIGGHQQLSDCPSLSRSARRRTNDHRHSSSRRAAPLLRALEPRSSHWSSYGSEAPPRLLSSSLNSSCSAVAALAALLLSRPAAAVSEYAGPLLSPVDPLPLVGGSGGRGLEGELLELSAAGGAASGSLWKEKSSAAGLPCGASRRQERTRRRGRES